MRKQITDIQADHFILGALIALALNCIHPLLGIIVQLPLIVVLVTKCDIKTIPALMLLMLNRANIVPIGGEEIAIRIGIALTPGSLFLLSTFCFALLDLLRGRYDSGTKLFCFFWLLSIIPGVIMSFSAKKNGVTGFWSDPLMDSIIPSVYLWALSMGRTYVSGKLYFVRRMAMFMMIWNFLTSVAIVRLFTVTPAVFSICMCIYVYCDPSMRKLRPLCAMGFLFALLNIVFGRNALAASMYEETGKVLMDSEKYGSSFAGMLVPALGWVMAISIYMWPKFIVRTLPLLMVAFNVLFVAFVITTQGGNKAVEITTDIQTVEDRFKFKLFGDRANVWTEGWNEVIEPPYFIKDLRSFIVFDPVKGAGMKLLPHNQFLTLLGRKGLWLGLMLSLFIVWIYVRMFRCATKMPYDRLIWQVFLPVGGAIFVVIGTVGQAVATGMLWANAVVCVIAPGFIYGHWLEQEKMKWRMMDCAYSMD
jgi:hypothetical protein